MEKRAPLIPRHGEYLNKKYNVQFVVQSSAKRIFKDGEYRSAGAEISADLSDCPVIMGVKEIPEIFFEKDKTYMFFSHVIKGQSYNMPMLRKMMELGCNLIDFETVTDESGNRLIFFGRFAGIAGMINSLWSLGERLKEQGYGDNPFLKIRQSHRYDSLEEAKKEIAEAGREIGDNGLPRELLPFTIGFTGYGNVSTGAQEIADLLPLQQISPRELLEIDTQKNLSPGILYKVVFKEKDLVRPKETSHTFELQDYYDHPERYENDFEKYIPHLTVLMNCIYWDSRYPKIFTKDFAKKLFDKGKPKIRMVGDVTCDPNGSIEFTHKGTEIEDPVFVYNPHTGQPVMGIRGEGIPVMAVDILPSELPRESSEAFSEALIDFIPPIAKADFDTDYDSLDLPPEIKRALILHRGRLTPDYEYIRRYL